jgi:hypothetical protein
MTVLLKRTTFWNTTEKSFIMATESIGAISVPPSVIFHRSHRKNQPLNLQPYSLHTIAAWKFLKDQYKHCDRHHHCPGQVRNLMRKKIFGQPCIVIDHFPQTSAGVCAKISLTTLSFPATILSTLPHSRHNNPGEKVQYSTKRNRACKQQYQFQKITKPINKKMIVSDAKSSPNIGKYLIFSPLSNLFQFFHNKSKQLCLFPPSQKTDRHKMPLSTVPSQNFHLQNKYHFLHCLYETKSALFQPVENQHC